MMKLLTTKDFREIQLFLDNHREMLNNRIRSLQEKDFPNETLIEKYESNVQKISQAQELILEVMRS